MIEFLLGDGDVLSVKCGWRVWIGIADGEIYNAPLRRKQFSMDSKPVNGAGLGVVTVWERRDGVRNL